MMKMKIRVKRRKKKIKKSNEKLKLDKYNFGIIYKYL